MTKELVILGGGAGGASVAAEAKRRDESRKVTMIEAGPHVSADA